MQQARFCPFTKQSTSLHHLLWSQILVTIVQPRRWTHNHPGLSFTRCVLFLMFFSSLVLQRLISTVQRVELLNGCYLLYNFIPYPCLLNLRVKSLLSLRTLQSACISKHESYSLSRECFAAQGASISLISNFISDYILLQAQRPLHYSWYRLGILSVFSGVLWCAFPYFNFAFSSVSKRNWFLLVL